MADTDTPTLDCIDICIWHKGKKTQLLIHLVGMMEKHDDQFGKNQLFSGFAL